MHTPRFVNTQLAAVALKDINGLSFEHFCNDFMPGLIGASYVPLGGTADGGADGFDEATIRQSTDGHSYFQATVRSDIRTKVRSTVKRLREFGRKPGRLTLLTAAKVAHVDQLEQSLSTELDCNIAIRDAPYICAHLNDNDQTRAAFWQYLCRSPSTFAS